MSDPVEEDRRAVIDGVPVRTSISAINRFIGCERSWWFRYVKRLPDPPGPAAEAGTAAHKRLEHYFETGDMVLGSAERALLPILPVPGPGVIGHGPGLKLRALDFGGIPVTGAFDLLNERPAVAKLTDFKFKGRSSFGKFEADDWRQLLAYAEDYRRTHPNATALEVEHMHSLREGEGRPKADSGCVRVPLDEVNRQWQSLADSVSPRLREVASKTQARDVAANPRQCMKWGKPCVYMKVCPLSAGQRIVAAQRPAWGKGEEMGLLSQKMAGLANGTATIVPPPAVDTSTARGPVVPPTAQQSTPVPRTFEIGSTYRLSDGSPGVLTEITGRIGRFKANPGTSEASWRDTTLDSVGEVIATAPALPIQSPVPAPEVPAEPKRGRGRPPKAKTEAAESAPSKYDGPARLVLPEGAELRLYFVGSPLGVATKTLHSYVSGLEAEILKDTEEQCGDVRLSTHKLLDFGKWRGALAQQALESPPPPGHYIIGDDEKERAVAHALVPLCSPGAVVR